MKTAKKEFENLVYQSIKSQGLDELSSKLIRILYLMTLEELSEKTNYSFSAVSAAMKMTIDQVKSKNELMVAPAIKKLPAIIQRCKKR
jgi:DNA-binding transcriptional regulator GbsR (MarR family)